MFQPFIKRATLISIERLLQNESDLHTRLCLEKRALDTYVCVDEKHLRLLQYPQCEEGALQSGTVTMTYLHNFALIPREPPNNLVQMLPNHPKLDQNTSQ